MIKPKNIVLFASGSGSNVENIVNYFSKTKTANITHLFCNKPDAFVLERAKRLKIPATVFSKLDFYDTDFVLNKLKELDTDLIVLAGFLWLTPPQIIKKYTNKIINIHPALLPKFGGKGMYGMHVHQAVLANKETETGITIHFVNEKYDEGKILFQAKVKVEETDSLDEIANKIHQLEYLHFPKEIEKICLS
ncbi:MAG: phosphoribosylglycinamide formyltransferase [Bacteroidetes bacterium]|nr:MAG: phosphoribosylglycinamide formyltransferase [Bacteroidota bacterium]